MSDAIVFSNFKGKGYSDVFPDIRLLGEIDFFLNCDSYQVLLPRRVPQTSEFNLFEQTILKLLALRPMMTPSEIAELLCLEGDSERDKSDFISCILSSLVEREYLDLSYRLTEKSRKVLPGASPLESEQELTTQRVFAFRGTDSLIPLVCADDAWLTPGDYSPRRVSDFSSEHIKIGVIRTQTGASVGTASDIFARAYTIGESSQAQPTGESARKVLQCAKEPTLTPSGPVFVHLKAIVQDGNAEDLLISDGFVRSNDALVRYLCGADPSFKLYMVTQAQTKYQEAPSRKRLHANGDKYRLVREFLAEVKLPSDTQNADDRRKAKKEALEAFRKLFAAFERTLDSYLKNTPPDEQIKAAFCEQTKEENRKLGLRMARSLGFSTNGSETAQLLGRCDGELLRRDLNGLGNAPTLDRLLPICLAVGERNPNRKTNSGWHRVAAEFPNLLPALSILREYAKKVRHADDTDKIAVGSLKYLNAMTQRIVVLLLPDFESMDAETSEIANESAKKVNALAKLLTGNPDDPDKLTYMQYDRLPEGAKQEVLTISPSHDEDGTMLAPLDFILALYRTAEIVLREKIMETFETRTAHTKAEALCVLAERLGEGLPVGLAKVGDHFYNAAVNRHSASLGAYALVWATHMDAVKFDRKVMAEILEFVSQIAYHRGHGNDIGLSLSAEQLKAYRRGLFTLIKKMEE